MLFVPALNVVSMRASWCLQDFFANFDGDPLVKIPWVRRDLSGPQVGRCASATLPYRARF
jgi:hypothetical protein